MSYNNPTPVAVGLVRCGQGLLAVMRVDELNPGWALPGGFIDAGETAEMAVAREIREETGFNLDPVKFMPVRTEITPNNRLLIFMIYEDDMLEEELDGFVPSAESSAIRIVTEDEELCFPLHTKLLQMTDLWY